MNTYQIGGKEYPITENLVTNIGTLPLVDIHMMTDEKWDRLCLESRKKHREKYAQYEDVDAVISELERRLSNSPSGALSNI